MHLHIQHGALGHRAETQQGRVICIDGHLDDGVLLSTGPIHHEPSYGIVRLTDTSVNDVV